MDNETTIVAIGGNALHPEETDGTAEEQNLFAERIAQSLLPLIKNKKHLIITYGKGPVVGKILLRQILSKDELAPMPLDICVAHSQGGIAYLLVQALENLMWRNKIDKQAVTIMTRVIVSKSDPSFANPSKPIGMFYTERQAKKLIKDYQWCMKNDAARGWRYFVPSPAPLRVLEMKSMRNLLDTGTIVVAGGGGGIPVVEGSDGVLSGIPAVIDKDRTSALLGQNLRAKTLILLTATSEVYLNYGTEVQQKLERCSSDELEQYMLAGHFAPGSMLPKIEAAVSFLRNGGSAVLITSPTVLSEALQGRGGSWFFPSKN